VRVCEPGRAGLLADPHPSLLEIAAQQRVLAYGRGDLTDTREQPGIVE
jgi:hypothetical protein